MNKAIFFDRDGIVNYRIAGEYIDNISKFHFTPDFFKFFKFVKDNQFLAILVTNQQGIGKTIMTKAQLKEVHSFMQNMLNSFTGYCFDDIYFCPDLASSFSQRRKPKPGMLLEAISKWNIIPEQSIMIGDRRSDIIAGKNANVKTILVGHEARLNTPNADFAFFNFYSAQDFLKSSNLLISL